MALPLHPFWQPSIEKEVLYENLVRFEWSGPLSPQSLTILNDSLIDYTPEHLLFNVYWDGKQLLPLHLLQAIGNQPLTLTLHLVTKAAVKMGMIIVPQLQLGSWDPDIWRYGWERKGIKALTVSITSGTPLFLTSTKDMLQYPRRQKLLRILGAQHPVDIGDNVHVSA